MNAIAHNIVDMQDMVVSKFEWSTALSACEFLEFSALLTEYQLGRNFMTFSFSTLVFNRLQKRLHDKVDSGDPTLAEIAKKMLEKLDVYHRFIINPLA